MKKNQYSQNDSFCTCKKCNQNKKDKLNSQSKEVLNGPNKCEMNDTIAKNNQSKWKELFPSATLLPEIGFPDKGGNGVMTLTHSLNTNDFSMSNLTINGLESKSPLANNALFSSECSGNKYLNLYEVMLPDLPGENGARSTVQIYIDTLAKSGIQVSASHYHWTGVGSPFMLAIHSYNIGMSPNEFTELTLRALEKTINVIEKRM